MDKSLLNNSISRAAMLMNDPHFNSIVESKARGGKKGGNGREFSHLESQVFGFSSPQTQQTLVNEAQTQQPQFQTPSILPSAIRESFSLNGTAPQQQQTYVTEAQVQQPMIQTSLTTGVNYEIIKALIDESISRHLNEIKQTLINESANHMKGFSFGEGNKVTFVDKKGNVFEGKLELKKKK
jgi:hypothetical protein